MRQRTAVAWGFGAVVGAGLAVAAGCSVVTSYDGFTPDGAPTCGKRIPDRPPATTSGGSAGDLVGAMTSIRFIDEPDLPALGFDLDKLCTCPDRRSCTNKNGNGTQCDVPNTGIDNAAGAILRGLFPDEANGRLQDSIKHGRNGLVVQVKDWDGTSDDASVTVALFNVAGLKGDVDGGPGATFEGDDDFIVDSSSLLNPTDIGSRFLDTSAYVTKGVLVASLDFDLNLQVPSATGGTSVAVIGFRPARFVGKIARSGTGGLKMTDAQLVGRLSIASIFEQLSRIGLCRDSPQFPGIKAAACASLDLPFNPSSDGKNVACDALSIAIGTPIGAARIGGADAGPDAQSPCGTEPEERCP